MRSGGVVVIKASFVFPQASTHSRQEPRDDDDLRGRRFGEVRLVGVCLVVQR